MLLRNEVDSRAASIYISRGFLRAQRRTISSQQSARARIAWRVLSSRAAQ